MKERVTFLLVNNTTISVELPPAEVEGLRNGFRDGNHETSTFDITVIVDGTRKRYTFPFRHVIALETGDITP